MSDSPALILYDSLGNPVGVILDGSIYRLQVEAKLTDGYNVLGTIANPLITSFSEAPKKILYDIGESAIYVGYASLGAAPNAANWLIKKITLSNGTPESTLWSIDSAVWDNRISEMYS